MKIKNSVLSALLVVSLMFLLAGCFTSRPVFSVPELPSSQVQSGTSSSSLNSEQLQGSCLGGVLSSGPFCYASDDEIDTCLFFYYVGGELFLESSDFYEDSLMSYWMGEITPDDSEMILENGRTSLTGTIRRFSGFSMAGNYWDDGVPISISLSDNDILSLRMDNSEPVTAARGTVSGEAHSDKDTLLSYLDVQGDFEKPCGGEWQTDSSCLCYLKLTDEGDLTFLWKPDDEPVFLIRGAYVPIQTDADTYHLTLIGERIGYAGMPFAGAAVLSLNSDETVELVPDGEDNSFFPESFAGVHLVPCN